MTGTNVEIQGIAPTRLHEIDAGADLYTTEDVTLKPGERMLVPTGTRINLPAGFVGYVTPRSGLAHKHGITVLNAPGVVDAGYTGEIKVNLINLGTEEVKLVEGERVAQFVVQPVTLAKFTQVPAFGVRYGDRGERGHGSTGTT